MSNKQLDDLRLYLLHLHVTAFHHGDCIGADTQALRLVRELFPVCVIHGWPQSLIPSKVSYNFCHIRHASMHPLDRNKRIVDASDLLIAAPKTETEQLRSGTWATVRYAKYRKKNVHILFP